MCTDREVCSRCPPAERASVWFDVGGVTGAYRHRGGFEGEPPPSHHYLPPPYRHRSCLHKRRAHAHNIIGIHYAMRVRASLCVRALYSGPLSPRRRRSVGKLSSHYCRFHKGRAGAISGNPLTVSLSLSPPSAPPPPESYSRHRYSIMYTLYDVHTTRARTYISMVRNNIIYIYNMCRSRFAFAAEKRPLLYKHACARRIIYTLHAQHFIRIIYIYYIVAAAAVD